VLNVFLTCDTEIWCGGWDDLDARFPDAFDRYVYGRSRDGRMFALPHQLGVLRDHGLHAVYFVEPLFSARFGGQHLREIVGLIGDAGQEVQLHLHTEWVDEWPQRPFPDVGEKRQYLRQFDTQQQRHLIDTGARLLEAAGAQRPNAFRAGGYGLDHRTLEALSQCGFEFDSSYNAVVLGASSGVSPGAPLHDLKALSGIVECPVSIFRDGTGRLRPAQVGACSADEMEQALWRAAEQGLSTFVIVFHNFEMLNARKDGPDPVVVRRFERLCRFLAAHRDHFRTRGFREPAPGEREHVPALPQVGFAATARRWAEQAYRRFTA
jgi:peptidoglycan/xylan/chitin deacetylase (PgdA/CDA1 family)